jgi:hypothetical protein
MARRARTLPHDFADFADITAGPDSLCGLAMDGVISSGSE